MMRSVGRCSSVIEKVKKMGEGTWYESLRRVVTKDLWYNRLEKREEEEDTNRFRIRRKLKLSLRGGFFGRTYWSRVSLIRESI